MNRVNAVLLGGFIAGFLDIAYAIIVFGIRSQVSAMRIGQGIASHVMGLASFDGGWGTAIVGFLLHFAIAMVMALGFYLVCKRVPTVARHVIAFFPVYGLLLFMIMTYVVAPLTDPKHRGFPEFPPAVDFSLYSAIFAHLILVALPIAIFTKRALKDA